MISSNEDMTSARPGKKLRIDPMQLYTRPSIVIATPESTQPILPTAASQATCLARFCAPLESELLHQTTLFKSRLRSIRSGPEFWRCLAKGLTNLLGAQYACISKRLDIIESNTGMPSLDKEGSCILALVWYYDGGDSKTRMYEDVKYTELSAPCSLMRHNATALVPSGLWEIFPENPNKGSFAEPADAYLGVPMFDDEGVNVGHICVLWTKEGNSNCPYSWTTMEFVLHIFVEMATQQFLANADVAFEKEDTLAKTAVNSTLLEVAIEPTSATELGSPSHIDSPNHNPSMFLPFPAAVAANISHEIRTPLQGIIGLLEILYAQVDPYHTPSSAAMSPLVNGDNTKPSAETDIKSLLNGIEENSNRLMDFADKLGEYCSIATNASSFESSAAELNQKRKLLQDDSDEEIVWITGGAQRKFIKRRKLMSTSTTEGDDSSSVDNQPSQPRGAPRSIRESTLEHYQVSIRRTIRQIVKHVLTQHEVAALWGGKKLGLVTHNPETRMRSIMLGEGEQSLLVEWNVSDDVPRWLYCGKIGLQKAVAQLLINAIKFTPTGRITLRVTRQPAKLSVTMRSNNDTVLFSVKDTGIGVKEQHQQYLAQPFFQVDPSMTRAREGSGLGLLLTQRWAQKMGGELRLESSYSGIDDPRHGSEFCLRLPIVKASPLTISIESEDSDDEWADLRYKSESPTSHSDQEKSSDPKRKELATADNTYDSQLAALYPFKIMVVEDNEMLRRLMFQLLQKLGYKSPHVVLCSNGLEAVDYFRTRSPNDFDINLIFMDCWMPIMDGMDATKLILDMFPSDMKKFPGIKPDIVAVTADNLPANLERAEGSGMRGYMVKPIKLNDLQRVIEECAEGNWIMKKLAS